MIDKRLRIAKRLLIILLTVACVKTARGQNASTGALTGMVTDASGGVIQGASIKVISEATGEIRDPKPGGRLLFRNASAAGKLPRHGYKGRLQECDV